MKFGQIEKILADFYEGKTSEEQEEMLKKYFAEEDVPEHLQPDRKLFLSFHSIPEIPESDKLETKLINLIDNKASEGIKVFHRNRSQQNWRWITGVAAGLLLVLSMSYSFGLFGLGLERPKDTFTDPYEAYNVMQATLKEVSANLNSGMEQLSEAGKDIKKINNEIKEEIQ